MRPRNDPIASGHWTVAMSQKTTVRDLLDEHGTTYAGAAGIKLKDTPSPLFQLLVLTMLSSTRISADIAVDAARELFKAGWRTPEKMRAATWQQRVDALGLGSYRRYDESTSTKLEELSAMLIEQYDGDLRRLRPSGDGAADDLAKAIASFPRIGPTGAKIFVREVQDVWPEVAPYFDDRALTAARRLKLPTDPQRLAKLAPDGRIAPLAAALVRSELES
jgi:endonuclease III